jgi:hypothetical protein
MAQEINLGGTIYISTKRAAEITRYTQDYIGQLARSGHIIAQRVSGLWYVVEESLRNYKSKADEFKPIPPPPPQAHELTASVSFDGRDYVSAQRAAQITGYHQDYVGQLARSGKVLSRQIGNRWYVDRHGLVEHKKHADALLAAVQAESVGLERPITPMPPHEPELHYTYVPQANEPLSLPELQSRQSDVAENNTISDQISSTHEDRANEIPIRVIRPGTVAKTPRPEDRFHSSLTAYRSSTFVTGMLTLTIVIVLLGGIGYFYAFKRPVLVSAYRIVASGITSGLEVMPLKRIPDSIRVPDFIKNLISNELYYRRDSF